MLFTLYAMAFIVFVISVKPAKSHQQSSCETYTVSKDNLNELKNDLRNKLRFMLSKENSGVQITASITNKNIVCSKIIGDYCYWIHLGTDQINFTSASSICKEKGFDLAVVPDIHVHQAISSQARLIMMKNDVPLAKFWTGMVFNPSTGNLIHPDGVKEILWRVYHKWDDPKYSKLRNVIMFVQKSGTNDQGMMVTDPLSEFKGLICEKKLGLQFNNPP